MVGSCDLPSPRVDPCQNGEPFKPLQTFVKNNRIDPTPPTITVDLRFLRRFIRGYESCLGGVVS